MEIPTLKILLTYKKDEEVKNILIDYIKNSNDKYASLHVQNVVHARNPFETELTSDIYEKTPGCYLIETYNGTKVIDSIEVNLEYVLEFDGRIFGGLKEIKDYEQE